MSNLNNTKLQADDIRAMCKTQGWQQVEAYIESEIERLKDSFVRVETDIPASCAQRIAGIQGEIKSLKTLLVQIRKLNKESRNE